MTATEVKSKIQALQEELAKEGIATLIHAMRYVDVKDDDIEVENITAYRALTDNEVCNGGGKLDASLEYIKLSEQERKALLNQNSIKKCWEYIDPVEAPKAVAELAIHS